MLSGAWNCGGLPAKMVLIGFPEVRIGHVVVLLRVLRVRQVTRFWLNRLNTSARNVTRRSPAIDAYEAWMSNWLWNGVRFLNPSAVWIPEPRGAVGISPSLP